MNWLKNNFLAISISIILGLIVFWPNVLMFSGLERAEFKGIYPVISDDEIYYQGRVQEILQGNFTLGNIYLKEHKDDLFLQPPLSEWIYAGFVKLSGVSVPMSMIIGDFLFTVAGYLLLYSVFLALTKNKKISNFYTTLYYFLFLETFGRPISPQLNILFLYIGLLFIIKIFHEGDLSNKSVSVKTAILGFVSGLTLFVSPYHWTALLLLYFLLLILRFKEGWNFSLIKKNVLVFFIFFLPFALIYGYFLVKDGSLAGYSDAVIRLGLIRSHFPGSYINILLGFVSGVVLWINRKFLRQESRNILLALVLGIFILNLQNIITGQNLQFSSHYLMYVVLAVLLVLAGLRVKYKYFLIFAVVGLLLFIQRAEYMVALSHNFKKEEVVWLQQKSEVFDWLNSNSKENSVIYTLGGRYDYMIPVYTNNMVYRNFYASFFVVTQNEIDERWLIQNIFNKKFDKQYITENQREIWGNKFIDAYMFEENRRKIVSRILFKNYLPNERIPVGNIDGILEKYNELKKMPILDALKKYEINYILLCKEYEYYDETKFIFGKLNALKLVKDSGGELIYEIK